MSEQIKLEQIRRDHFLEDAQGHCIANIYFNRGSGADVAEFIVKAVNAYQSEQLEEQVS